MESWCIYKITLDALEAYTIGTSVSFHSVAVDQVVAYTFNTPKLLIHRKTSDGNTSVYTDFCPGTVLSSCPTAAEQHHLFRFAVPTIQGMDYLPLPRGRKTTFFEVPCLEIRDYYGLGFSSYPERLRYKSRTEDEWAGSSKTHHVISRRFWGHLDTILRRRISGRTFVRHGTHHPEVIDIADLMKNIKATDIKALCDTVGTIY
ncbi:uncharacterized protein BDZ99DRAFT_232379 [Mytilinidion resinicola]|uniref:Uncharacterized protein n=1 Tax=Mytilinidion resinicola TaxID=574789 RepID=A0A6A6Z1K2_9PEZI|nr:uncharacterized protein BDZ99DRAFT_232379 [Mytilinidion resinicola]KAF2814164.1 hypothetical protein BDZ99DRAFT_232379 [Mytilinidion resinicola]